MARKIIREISFNGKKYFSLNFASSLCGYHKDYFGQLIRKGELQGTRFKNSWFIEKEEYARFCEKSGIALKETIEKTADVKPLIGNAADSWDRMLLGLPDEVSAKDKIPVKLGMNYLPKKISKPFAAYLKTFLACLSIIIFLNSFLFYRHPESIQANFIDFKNFSHQVSEQVSLLKNSLQTSAFLAAVSVQETAFNLPNQARSLGEQTLNKTRSFGNQTLNQIQNSSQTMTEEVSQFVDQTNARGKVLFVVLRQKSKGLSENIQTKTIILKDSARFLGEQTVLSAKNLSSRLSSTFNQIISSRRISPPPLKPKKLLLS